VIRFASGMYSEQRRNASGVQAVRGSSDCARAGPAVTMPTVSNAAMENDAIRPLQIIFIVSPSFAAWAQRPAHVTSGQGDGR